MCATLEDRPAQVLAKLPGVGAQPPTHSPRGKQVESPCAQTSSVSRLVHREASVLGYGLMLGQNPDPKVRLRVPCHQPGFCMMSLPIQHPV